MNGNRFFPFNFIDVEPPQGSIWVMPGLNSGSFPPKSKFSTDQIPDLTGRVIIVTGGNTGVGKQTIKALLEHNAKVYMASRSKDKADVAIAELKALTGREAIFLELDLGSLASIRKAATEFLRCRIGSAWLTSFDPELATPHCGLLHDLHLHYFVSITTFNRSRKCTPNNAFIITRADTDPSINHI
ncbi:Retinol dehydrogenase 11 [Grifola frondosa]|uniref:Retinol dehydrogenase 11 n=1 Tax=Grifola frondosa TaxID=5627 RepID=A0A1C7M4E5_GRIFR|nr:Retinol dehydrogenase 11 [Grifola frondosa]